MTFPLLKFKCSFIEGAPDGGDSKFVLQYENKKTQNSSKKEIRFKEKYNQKYNKIVKFNNDTAVEQANISDFFFLRKHKKSKISNSKL